MTYDNNMTGALFKNKKRDTDKHPHARGSCEIDGVEYWISAWTNTAKQSGEKFQSLKFERKDAKPAEASAPPADEEFDDEIPF